MYISGIDCFCIRLSNMEVPSEKFFLSNWIFVGRNFILHGVKLLIENSTHCLWFGTSSMLLVSLRCHVQTKLLYLICFLSIIHCIKRSSHLFNLNTCPKSLRSGQHLDVFTWRGFYLCRLNIPYLCKFKTHLNL